MPTNVKRKHAPNPDQLSLLDYQAKIDKLIQETDADPDYHRYKQIFAELSREYDHVASPPPPSIQPD